MQVLEEAGAYISIEEYAQNCLLEADEVLGNELVGLGALNSCIRRSIPELTHDVSVRQYH
jgi:hypothetical protein